MSFRRYSLENGTLHVGERVAFHVGDSDVTFLEERLLPVLHALLDAPHGATRDQLVQQTRQNSREVEKKVSALRGWLVKLGIDASLLPIASRRPVTYRLRLVGHPLWQGTWRIYLAKTSSAEHGKWVGFSDVLAAFEMQRTILHRGGGTCSLEVDDADVSADLGRRSVALVGGPEHNAQFERVRALMGCPIGFVRHAPGRDGTDCASCRAPLPGSGTTRPVAWCKHLEAHGHTWRHAKPRRHLERDHGMLAYAPWEGHHLLLVAGAHSLGTHGAWLALDTEGVRAAILAAISERTGWWARVECERDSDERARNPTFATRDQGTWALPR